MHLTTYEKDRSLVTLVAYFHCHSPLVPNRTRVGSLMGTDCRKLGKKELFITAKFFSELHLKTNPCPRMNIERYPT